MRCKNINYFLFLSRKAKNVIIPIKIIATAASSLARAPFFLLSAISGFSNLFSSVLEVVAVSKLTTKFVSTNCVVARSSERAMTRNVSREVWKIKVSIFTRSKVRSWEVEAISIFSPRKLVSIAVVIFRAVHDTKDGAIRIKSASARSKHGTSVFFILLFKFCHPFIEWGYYHFIVFVN